MLLEMSLLSIASFLGIPASSSKSLAPFRRGCHCSLIGGFTSVARLPVKYHIRMSLAENYAGLEQKKFVWVWTDNKEVMTAAVERGWNTFVFSSEPQSKKLVNDWTCKVLVVRAAIAFIRPLFIEGSNVLDEKDQKVAELYDISSPEGLKLLQLDNEEADALVINFQGGCKVIPAENLVAALQHSKRTILAVSTTSYEAQVFLEALEKGLSGVVLKVKDVEEIIALKGYFDRRDEVRNLLSLTKATVTRVELVGMGDRVCVDLCNIMKPGEGLLVGSFARGLFLVHSECLESNYIASRPFRVNAGPVHSYVAIPGGRTSYLSELQAGKEVIVVDRIGVQWTAIVGRVKIESRPLILVEAKIDSGNECFSIFLQNAETVGLVCPNEADEKTATAIPVTSLKVGDEVMLRIQGGARHTGIEIQEFILEK